MPPKPADPSNRFADHPEAAALGAALFFDPALSANGQVACATCHRPEQGFQDGLELAEALSTGVRRTMPLAGIQWGGWFFWDGRKDSLWSQALEPFENPLEHGLTRPEAIRKALAGHREAYQALFGSSPDMTGWPDAATPLLPGPLTEAWNATPQSTRDAIDAAYANLGKALAAYVRTIEPQENRFDRAVAALSAGRDIAANDALTAEEIAGFRLFTGKARCANCHSGPLFTDHFFHNTGVPHSPRLAGVDFGRALILPFIGIDPFNCFGPHSDAQKEACRELRFMSKDPKVFEGAFKTPSLRGVAARPPYMHAGQIATLEAVVEHYAAAPDPFSLVPDASGRVIDHGRHSALVPLELTPAEKAALLAFLRML